MIIMEMCRMHGRLGNSGRGVCGGVRQPGCRTAGIFPCRGGVSACIYCIYIPPLEAVQPHGTTSTMHAFGKLSQPPDSECRGECTII